ncbi:hypothetical protein E3P99_00311 [Wallemia hederae]|uniref:Peptidase M50 domain-containing protein n=1 Tax=Wallemia hederae TaxID=1540922 RepID=A0A4T0FWQ7_9BASI|nr:hypothetical protein E3P99_00311 [Wallemia hederae]
MFIPAEKHIFRREANLSVNSTQRTTLIVACVYVLVIGILWHVPYLRWLIYPFKLLTVGFHEFSHAIAGKLTGAKIESIRLDPHEGGETRMRGGWSFVTLPAGYLGSSLSYLLIIIFSALFIAFWFIKTLHALTDTRQRYVILFIGVMSCLYSIWDIIDDTLIRKVASSDAVQMSYAFGCVPSRGWGFIWL